MWATGLGLFPNKLADIYISFIRLFLDKPSCSLHSKRQRNKIMTTRREKFSSQANPQLLAALREVARREGRQFQAVLEDAMRSYIESHTQQKSRASVMGHFRSSIEKNRRLGKILAE
jgi:hypothetical protein